MEYYPQTDPGTAWLQDLADVERMPVKVHGALKCWSPNGKDSTDLDRLTTHLVRCKPRWQNKLGWRRDWVWVQEIPGVEESLDILNGKLPGQLKIIYLFMTRTELFLVQESMKFTPAHL